MLRSQQGYRWHQGHWGLLGGLGVLGALGAVRECWGCQGCNVEAGRVCRYSGARRDIGGIGTPGGVWGARGHWWAVRKD